MSDAMMVVTVAVVAVLVLIIVFMAVDGGSNSVTNVFMHHGRGHHYPYGPGHSSRWGPYYQHGGRTPSNGLLY
jgi:hypothetical protein